MHKCLYSAWEVVGYDWSIEGVWRRTLSVLMLCDNCLFLERKTVESEMDCLSNLVGGPG